MDSDQKKCQKCGEDFLIIKQEMVFYKEKELPFPKNCPLCRQKRRLALRSEQKLYGSKCDKCSKDIIVAFKPPKDQKVFCKKCYLDYFDKFDQIIKD